MFQTGEQMGDVDLKIRFKMEDLANVTQMLMQMRKALAVPQEAGVVTGMHTANVLDAQILGKLLQIMVNIWWISYKKNLPSLLFLPIFAI